MFGLVNVLVKPLNSAYAALWCRTVVTGAQESWDFKRPLLNVD